METLSSDVANGESLLNEQRAEVTSLSQEIASLSLNSEQKASELMKDTHASEEDESAFLARLEAIRYATVETIAAASVAQEEGTVCEQQLQKLVEELTTSKIAEAESTKKIALRLREEATLVAVANADAEASAVRSLAKKKVLEALKETLKSEDAAFMQTIETVTDQKG